MKKLLTLTISITIIVLLVYTLGNTSPTNKIQTKSKEVIVNQISKDKKSQSSNSTEKASSHTIIEHSNNIPNNPTVFNTENTQDTNNLDSSIDELNPPINLDNKNIEHKKSNNSKSKIIEIKTNDGSSKQITIINRKMTDAEKEKILEKAQKIDTKKLYFGEIEVSHNDLKAVGSDRKNPDGTLYISHDLSMGNTPVLDQGEYGSCVTFASTVALNAKMNAGDFISQQCLLELGVHINDTKKCETDENLADPDTGKVDCSGWEGFMNTSTVLSRINKYGVVDKKQCMHNYANSKYSLSNNEYLTLSNYLWANMVKYKKLSDGNVAQVKAAINNKHRVVIGVLLHEDYSAGVPINNKPYGLWELQKSANETAYEILYKDKLAGGHALLITGYDDELKLIKVRNSWGSNIGDSGEFYMSYNYYNLLNIDAYEVL